MQLKGNLADISKNWMTGRFRLTFEVEQDITDYLDSIRDKVVSLCITKWKEKRSLDANAYYWKLTTELSDKLNVSKSYMHNHMLRHYGRPEIIDGRMIYLVVPDDEEGTRRADEADTYHIKPTSEVKTGKDGGSYRTYIMLRGSSTYNTKEMSILIDGLVQECKEQSIQTLPPEEFDRMMQSYDLGWRKKNEINHTE